jgi:hypothetical protein
LGILPIGRDLVHAKAEGGFYFGQYQRDSCDGQENSALCRWQFGVAIAHSCGAQVPKRHAAQWFKGSFDFSQQE